jgi:hypothetical protein
MDLLGRLHQPIFVFSLCAASQKTLNSFTRNLPQQIDLVRYLELFPFVYLLSAAAPSQPMKLLRREKRAVALPLLRAKSSGIDSPYRSVIFGKGLSGATFPALGLPARGDLFR